MKKYYVYVIELNEEVRTHKKVPGKESVLYQRKWMHVCGAI